MQFRSTNNEAFKKVNEPPDTGKQLRSETPGFTPGLKKIRRRGKLSEEDLEILRLDIIHAHKKRHYRVLVVAAILFILAGLLLFYLLF